MKKLKSDLHLHTKEDIKSRGHSVDLTAKELIDIAADENYEVLAIANHKTVTYNQELVDYALKRNILLIPAQEIEIKKRHILLINFKEPTKIKSYRDIMEQKCENNLVIAPHPFFPRMYSLRNKVKQHLKLFDAIEFSGFYSNIVNFNKPALKFAQKYNIPIIGNSDTHYRFQFGTTYSLIESKKDIISIIKAIKSGKIEIISRPFTTVELSLFVLEVLFNKYKYLIKYLINISKK